MARVTSWSEPVERFENGCIGAGLGLDDIEEVACVEEDVRFFPDNCIDRRQDVVIDMPEVGVAQTLAIKSTLLSD